MNLNSTTILLSKSNLKMVFIGIYLYQIYFDYTFEKSTQKCFLANTSDRERHHNSSFMSCYQFRLRLSFSSESFIFFLISFNLISTHLRHISSAHEEFCLIQAIFCHFSKLDYLACNTIFLFQN